MCRLALKTADTPFSPYEVLTGMEAMQEGYDGSGLGLLLRGVSFEDYKYKKEDQIILSGIAHTEVAFSRLQRIMEERGFTGDQAIRIEYDGHGLALLPDGGLVITGHLGRSIGMASLMSITDAAWSMGMIVSPILSGLILIKK